MSTLRNEKNKIKPWKAGGNNKIKSINQQNKIQTCSIKINKVKSWGKKQENQTSDKTDQEKVKTK